MIFKKNEGFSLIELSIVLIIIGLLTSGVIGGTALMDAAALVRAKQHSKNFYNLWDADIPKPALWLDASNKDNFIKNSDNEISKWIDKSFKTNSAIQPSNTHQPIFLEKQLNKLPVVSFEGSDSFSIVNEIKESEGSIFFIYSSSETGTGGSILSSDLSGNLFYIQKGGATGPYQINTYVNAGFRFDTGNGVYSLISNIFNSPTSLTVYKDKISKGTMNPNISIDVKHIGKRFDSVYMTGYIAEMIIFDQTLNEDERKTVEKYLTTKWKL